VQPLIGAGKLSELCVVFFNPQGRPLDRAVLQFEVCINLLPLLNPKPWEIYVYVHVEQLLVRQWQFASQTSVMLCAA
jgi:hypothetical protein